MSANKNWIKLTIVIAGALMLIGVSGAQAFTVLEEDGMVYKILDLEIRGQDLPFNVEFFVDTADNVYGDPPTYDFTIGEVSAAVDAVNEALNSRNESGNSIWPYVGRQGSSDRYGYYGIGTGVASVATIDYTFHTGGYVRGDSVSGDEWVDDVRGTPFGGLRQSDLDYVWAKFSPVPIPAAAWLLGGGLIGLFAVRRRFKN